MSKEVTEILTKARENIINPAHWTKGAAFRGPSGEVCDEHVACQCCALGAVWAVSSQLNAVGSPGYQAEMLLHNVAIRHGFGHVPAFNDAEATTHEQVVALFDEAIKISKGTQ